MAVAQKILVVDDDSGVREMVRLVLTAAGYEAETAASCYQATRALEREPFALILLDFIMPGLDGVATLAQLRQLQPDIPIVMITAIGNETVHAEARRRGAASILQKPFEPQQLVGIVQEVLAGTA